MVRVIFLISVLFFQLQARSADDVNLMDRERELKVLLDSLRGATVDSVRNHYNKEFKGLLKETLEMEGAFSYAFDSLTSIGKLKSPDNAFRFFNWNVENNNHTNYYELLILVPGRGKNVDIIECTDKSAWIKKPDMKVLDPKNWYGCLYYKIILSKESSVSPQYTLLGWDLHSEASNKKIIELMILKGDKVTFGAPAFNIENVGIMRRIVLEYNAKAMVKITYEPSKNMLIYDHLVPETPFGDGIYEFYIPDGSFDGFELQSDGTWFYLPDVDARRGKDDSDKLYNPPK